MKNNIYRFSAILIFCLQISSAHAQTTNSMPPPVIRDRWDTLYANVNYTNSSTYLYQVDNCAFGNQLGIISDSIGSSYSTSYFQVFNSSNNTLVNINYNRFYFDAAATDGAVYTNTASGTHEIFFGAKNTSSTSLPFGIYKYSSSTNAITSESLAINSNNIYSGTMNMGFFSPSTGNDSLSIFVGINYVNGDSVYIYRKHYNQSGFISTGIQLPVQLARITQVFTFAGEMYVAGHDNMYNGKLLKSSDGINFTNISNFETNYPYKYVVDAKVFNNKVYLGLGYDGSPGYEIIETPDGTNFTTIMSNNGSYAFSSMEIYNNAIWYSYYVFFGSKTNPLSQNINSINYDAPYVGYLDPTNGEVLSIDTLGRFLNQGETYKLKVVNSKLLFSGNYFDPANSNTPGNFVYQFIPPVANFSVSSNNLCLNSPYTFVDQSLNSDSVRWYVDNNFYASVSTNFTHFFNTTGSHTLGLIAISGTQKDSLQYTINVYSITTQYNASTSGCLNNKISITSTIPGAFPPITYSWNVSSALTQTSLINPNVVVSTSIAGTYTYMLSASDANGCSAYGATGNLMVLPNKDITGAVDVASTPLATGNVILYKYEPVLTKFDSVTYQPLSATGTYTFALADAFTYIIKCEPASNTLMITYAPSETSWKTATIVTHGCSSGTSRNISVVPLQVIGTGPGVLSGKIVEGVNYGGKGVTVPGNPIGGISVKGGKNPGGGISAQGKTDASGGYTFTNLPLSAAGETYFILVDIPGLDTNHTYHRVITAGSSSFTDLDFAVDSAKINPLSDVNVKELSIGNDMVKIFPNPANAVLNVHIMLDHIQKVSLKLFDITGKEILDVLPTYQYFNRELKIQTKVSDIEAGVYFMKVSIGDTERSVRIVITD